MYIIYFLKVYKLCYSYVCMCPGNMSLDVPVSVPWFEAWRETFLQVQFPSDHEFTKHYVACILNVL